MWGFISIAIAFVVLAVLATSDLHSSIAGLSPGEWAGLLAFMALLAGLAGGVYDRMQSTRPWTKTALIALLVAAVPVVLHTRSDDIIAYFDSYIADVKPGRVVESQGGEVIVAQGSRGGFTVEGTIDGYETRFLFDTGATTVVLTHETAIALGINVNNLDYSVGVSTANGNTFAARYTIDTLSIGSITERDVNALIAQEDALNGNLLGMSFLTRLHSYEVRGNRLILRGG